MSNMHCSFGLMIWRLSSVQSHFSMIIRAARSVCRDDPQAIALIHSNIGMYDIVQSTLQLPTGAGLIDAYYQQVLDFFNLTSQIVENLLLQILPENQNSESLQQLSASVNVIHMELLPVVLAVRSLEISFLEADEPEASWRLRAAWEAQLNIIQKIGELDAGHESLNESIESVRASLIAFTETTDLLEQCQSEWVKLFAVLGSILSRALRNLWAVTDRQAFLETATVIQSVFSDSVSRLFISQTRVAVQRSRVGKAGRRLLDLSHVEISTARRLEAISTPLDKASDAQWLRIKETNRARWETKPLLASAMTDIAAVETEIRTLLSEMQRTADASAIRITALRSEYEVLKGNKLELLKLFCRML